MGKHTAFVYIAYIFSIVVLLLGYYFPHYALKKEIRIKNDKNNKNK
jgi:heme exporter protein D